MKLLFLVTALVLAACHQAKEEVKKEEAKKIIAMTAMNQTKVKAGDDIPYNK